MEELNNRYCIVDSPLQLEVISLILLSYGIPLSPYLNNFIKIKQHEKPNITYIIFIVENILYLWTGYPSTKTYNLQPLYESFPDIKEITYKEIRKY